MLTRDEQDRVESLWVPEAWPDGVDAAYAAAGQRQPFSYFVERVRHLGLSGERLIDAGCGTGNWCFAFATRFDHVLGVDLLAPRVAAADWLKNRFELEGLDFVQADVRAIPAPDESVDAAHSRSVALGWVPLEVILAESFRVLKPGGVCYMGLNGPGFAYYLANSADAKIALAGRTRIYNDICQPFLSPLVADIGPGGARHEAARDRLATGAPAAQVLRTLSARPAQIEAAERIETDLGPEFGQTLIGDLVAIAEGRQTAFSHDKSGRGYDPDELCASARAVGFSRFEWALDGCLSLQPDGSVRKGPSTIARPSLGEFEGKIRVYEALMWKPERPSRPRSP